MSAELTLQELETAAERDLGATDWVQISQHEIELFADATGDHQWIHIDPEAAAQGPFGTTVAHGYLSLSMIPGLLSQLLRVTDARMGVNYGIDKIRFTAPVPSGSEVRLKGKINSSEKRGDGVLYRLGVEIEIRGSDKPALVGEVLYLVF
jgi:acyl dehydratase